MFNIELITESNSILVDKFKTLNQDDQLEILIECTSLTSIIEGSSGVSYSFYEIIIEDNLSSKKVKDIIKNYQLQPFIVNDVITGIHDCTITPDSASIGLTFLIIFFPRGSFSYIFSVLALEKL